jgi:hypothetical protein
MQGRRPFASGDLGGPASKIRNQDYSHAKTDLTHVVDNLIADNDHRAVLKILLFMDESSDGPSILPITGGMYINRFSDWTALIASS